MKILCKLFIINVVNINIVAGPLTRSSGDVFKLQCTMCIN